MDTADADDSPNMVALVDSLQILGVDCVDATRYAMQIVKQHRSTRRPTFIEMYGAGHMVEMAHGPARNLNLKGLGALDLRTCKPNGQPWDFTRRSDRMLAYRLVLRLKPRWLIGSPPCGPFSSWQNINAVRMEPAERLR